MTSESGWTMLGGAIRGFAAKPISAPRWPAILVIHAVLGIDSYLEQLIESYAADGYYAFAPDIYAKDPAYKQHRQEHIEIAAHMGVDPAKQKEIVSDYPAETQGLIMKARDWMSARPGHTYIDTVRATFDRMKSQPEIRAVGSIGFCMGGRLVGELAVTGADLAAGIIHYGRPPRLDLVPNIRGPLEGHYATTDIGITSKIPAFAAAMKAAGKEFTHFIYEADHGFTLGANRFSEAKRLAMARSKDFLAQHLQDPARTAA